MSQSVPANTLVQSTQPPSPSPSKPPVISDWSSAGLTASVHPAGRRRRRPSISPPRADRLLVIRLGALGDVVRTLPAVAGLRAAYPGAHLTWLVEPSAAGVVQAAQIVDETLIFPRGDLVEALRAGDGLSLYRQVRSFVRQLRRRRFEIVLDFHGLAKSGLFAWLSGAPLRYGYGRSEAKEFAHFFTNREAVLPNGKISRFDRNAALVEALVRGIRIPTRLQLKPTDLATARLNARLRVSGRDRADGFVLIHPGASRGARYKRYPVAGWVSVCRSLADAGVEVWLAAGTGRDERSLVDRIVRESRGVAIPAPETRSFDDLLALLSRTSVFVSGDTGPLHAASLCGVPVVQLLGPTDPVENQPWEGTPSRRLHVPLACSPCRHGCAEAACMKAIAPGGVVTAILELRERWNRGRAQRTRSAQAGRTVGAPPEPAG